MVKAIITAMSALQRAAQWLFFSALFVTVWMYGGTTALSINTMDWLLFGTVVVWLAELLFHRRRPRLPGPAVFLIAGLLLIGWWMVGNAAATYDSDAGMFAPLRKLIAAAPSSTDYAISAALMIRVTLLMLTLLFVADATQDSQTFLRVYCAVGVVAATVSLLGLLQKATGAEMIFWQSAPSEGPVKTFFGPFYYHGNAGAFLNLTLPITAGLALRGFIAPSGPEVRALWTAAFVLNLTSLAANTSRMAQFVAALLAIALAWQLGPRLLSRVSYAERKVIVTGVAAVLVLLFAVAQASHLEHPLRRWQQISEVVPNDQRWLAARVALSILPHAGAFGFGPATFRIVFPIYNNASGTRASGSWRFLHEDYLQTILEWGWIGSALWALLFFGAIGTAVVALRKQTRLSKEISSNRKSKTVRSATTKEPVRKNSISEKPSSFEWSPRRRLLIPLTVIALAGVAIHAAVDFPFQIASIQLYVATYLGLCWGTLSR